MLIAGVGLFRQVLLFDLENHLSAVAEYFVFLGIAEQAMLIAEVGLFKQVLLLDLENHRSAVAEYFVF